MTPKGRIKKVNRWWYLLIGGQDNIEIIIEYYLITLPFIFKKYHLRQWLKGLHLSLWKLHMENYCSFLYI
jgi:hypothetical protein